MLECIYALIVYVHAGNLENTEGEEPAVFVCQPGTEIPTTLLCDGVNDCGKGNDETTSLCESELDFSLSSQ